MNEYIKGVLYAVATAVTFGLIPLFTLPLAKSGLSFESILSYRFLIASFALMIMTLVKKESLRVKWSDVPMLFLLGLFYTGSALFLFLGYGLMGSGLATTFHFTYPIFVTLALFFVFRESSSWVVWVAIGLAIWGVALLSIGDQELSLTPMGVIMVLMSAACYGLYIVTVNKSRVAGYKGSKLAFYVFLFSMLQLSLYTQFKGGIQPLPMDTNTLINIAALALVPTVISNIALLQAIKRIGSTTTSVIGAFELIVAVSIGVLVFDEPFTYKAACGISLILIAVITMILKDDLLLFARKAMAKVQR